MLKVAPNTKEADMQQKPLGRKNYGHIPHLPGSRMQAHGTRYELSHEPFVVFDLMVGDKRMPCDEFAERIAVGEFVPPTLLHRGGPLSLDETLKRLGERGFHGSLDPVEGAVWRVERDKPTGKKGERRHIVDCLVKDVRPGKLDGMYLPELSGQESVWNWRP